MASKKTSIEWMKQFQKDIEIVEFEGWDKNNLGYSWNEEKITKDEFFSRVSHSTIRIKSSKFPEFLRDAWMR